MPIILYDLVSGPGKPYYSPNTWKTRLSLLHKKVPFVTKDVTYAGLRELGKRMGVERPTAPTIELEDGTFISDSFVIAEYLEKTYPDAPSLFLPANSPPVSFDSPENHTARTFAKLFDQGFGDSEPGWACFWELVAPKLGDTFVDEAPEYNRTYLTSDAKLGGKDTWAWLNSLDRETLLLRCSKSVLPLISVLSSESPHSPFLSGTSPGLVDYIAYGRYQMMRMCDGEATKRVWLEDEGLRGWILGIERVYGGEREMKEALGRLKEI